MISAALALWLALALVLAPSCSLAHCPACALRSEIRSISLEAIKREILSKLGMETAPNMTGRQMPNIAAPLTTLFDDVKSDFRQHATDEPDESSATTERVIAFAQPLLRVRHHFRRQDALYFKFSEKVQDNKVLKARLWLWLKDGKPSGVGPEEPINISVYKFRPDDTSQLSLVSTIKESVGRGDRWVSVDVKVMVSHWFRMPRDNFGLVVKTSGPGGKKAQVVTTHEDASLVPFVEVNTTEAGKKSRSKRTLGIDCQENSTETKCCRYPLRVDFEEFGWDWIIAPKKYEAHYCSGECPYVFLQEYTHTHLAQMSNKSTACCAPRKMSSISMLYFDNEVNIIYSILPGMVVDRCGCL